MEKNEKSRGIPFKDFLDKSTNLVTLFGVFNALFIYSSTIESDGAAEFLMPSFFILSILVWFELIFFSLSSDNGTKKYEFFYFLLCSVEIGLIYYFVIRFAGLVILLGFLGLFYLIVYLVTMFLVKVISRRIKRTNEKRIRNISLIIILSSIAISGLILKLTIPILRPLINKILTDKNQPKITNSEKQKARDNISFILK